MKSGTETSPRGGEEKALTQSLLDCTQGPRSSRPDSMLGT